MAPIISRRAGVALSVVAETSASASSNLTSDSSPSSPRGFFTALFHSAGRRSEDLGEFIRQIKMSLGVYIGRAGDFNKTLDCKVQIEAVRTLHGSVKLGRYRFLPDRSPSSRCLHTSRRKGLLAAISIRGSHPRALSPRY